MSSPTSVFKCEYFHLFIRKTHGAENRILGTIRSLMVVSCMYTTQHLRGHVILIDSTSPNKCCVPPTWTRINCRRKINAENNSVWGAEWLRLSRSRCNYYARKNKLSTNNSRSMTDLSWSFWHILPRQEMMELTNWKKQQVCVPNFPENSSKYSTSELWNCRYIIVLFRLLPHPMSVPFPSFSSSKGNLDEAINRKFWPHIHLSVSLNRDSWFRLCSNSTVLASEWLALRVMPG